MPIRLAVNCVTCEHIFFFRCLVSPCIFHVCTSCKSADQISQWCYHRKCSSVYEAIGISFDVWFSVFIGKFLLSHDTQWNSCAAEETSTWGGGGCSMTEDKTKDSIGILLVMEIGKKKSEDNAGENPKTHSWGEKNLVVVQGHLTYLQGHPAAPAPQRC